MLLRLQRLTPNLLPAALDLDRRCFGGLWTEAGYQREIESPNSELLVLQPESSTQLLGLGCYWAILEEAHITILAIDPAYQRQGLGQALLYTLLNSARQRRLERATLEVRASNQPAIALYQKFGFAEAGRRKRYYVDTGEDALVLWCGKLQFPQFSTCLQQWHSEIQMRLERSGWAFCPDLPPPPAQLT
jgi:ribosomal-protein-alanine N-acetyltransferase